MSATAEDLTRQQKLEQAKKLLEAIESGQDDAAQNILDELTAIREAQLFQDVGKITREVHDALRMFEADTELAGIAINDMPDATERLNYVIEATENAANTTMNVIDDVSPKLSDIRTTSNELSDAWERLVKNRGETAEYRATLQKVSDFIGDVADVSSSVNSGLTEVLMAQEFQDLTSQVLFKVITMVQTVEEHLVRLIKASGTRVVIPEKEQAALMADGPQIRDDNPNAVSGQDDVDDLLSSLGF